MTTSCCNGSEGYKSHDLDGKRLREESPAAGDVRQLFHKDILQDQGIQQVFGPEFQLVGVGLFQLLQNSGGKSPETASQQALEHLAFAAEHALLYTLLHTLLDALLRIALCESHHGVALLEIILVVQLLFIIGKPGVNVDEVDVFNLFVPIGFEGQQAKLCALVIVGVNKRGEKHFLTIEDGVRESTQR